MGYSFLVLGCRRGWTWLRSSEWHAARSGRRMSGCPMRSWSFRLAHAGPESLTIRPWRVLPRNPRAPSRRVNHLAYINTSCSGLPSFKMGYQRRTVSLVSRLLGSELLRHVTRSKRTRPIRTLAANMNCGEKSRPIWLCRAASNVCPRKSSSREGLQGRLVLHSE
jgi:hypothetical protein